MKCATVWHSELTAARRGSRETPDGVFMRYESIEGGGFQHWISVTVSSFIYNEKHRCGNILIFKILFVLLFNRLIEK